MAIIAVEGFDMYNGWNNTTATAIGASSRWVSGDNRNSLVTGRFGGQAIDPYTATDPVILPLGNTYTSGCVGFATYMTSLGGVYSFFGVGIGDAGYDSRSQFVLFVNTTGFITAQRYLTVLGTATTPILANVWNYIEIEFVLSNTVGEIRVYLNNNSTPILNISGVDNQYQAGNGFNCIGFNDRNTGVTYFDDVYVTDTPNRLGEQRVVTTYVNGDASPSSWTSSNGSAAPYTMIDETLCDGDTTYISSSTLNARAMFETASLSVVPTNVQAVQISCMARKTDTGLRKIQLQYEDTSANVASSSEFTLGTSYSHPVSLYPNNPLTSNPWSASDINSMKIGVKVST